ncbi:acyl-CoA dehydrogenase family protein [Rhizobium leguminosarum]|nr:acyl-CoA dehydrogenase family protein [Rhizobium leguminosarum]
MLGLTEPKQNLAGGRTIVELTNSVLPTIAQRAASIDESDTFVGENYALLKESGLVRAGVPIELGGLGAEVPELSEMLKSIARACGSTALAFSMHTHQVAIPAWRWRHQKGGRGGAAPETCCIGANHIALERRIGLDRRIGQGHES